jgi:hypothetical protein
MALQSSDIRPIELAKEALLLAKDSWKQVGISAGVFALLAGLIAVLTGNSVQVVALVGSSTASFAMFLAALTAGLVTSARALGIDIPPLASAMMNERQYWRYVGGGIACMFVSSMLGFIAFMIVMTIGGQVPSAGVASTQELAAPVMFASFGLAAVATGLMSIRLFMVLPAVVAGEKISLTESWKRTKGITIKLAIAIAISLGGFFALQLLVRYFGAHLFGAEGLPMVEMTNAVLRIARGAVEGAVAGLVMAKILDQEAIKLG